MVDASRLAADIYYCTPDGIPPTRLCLRPCDSGAAPPTQIPQWRPLCGNNEETNHTHTHAKTTMRYTHPSGRRLAPRVTSLSLPLGGGPVDWNGNDNDKIAVVVVGKEICLAVCEAGR